MTDEIKDKEEEIEDIKDEQPPEDKTKEEKKFTQAEVNRFNRREKEKSKQLQDDLDKLQNNKDETLIKYENTIQKMVDDMVADVPDSIKKLLLKLSPLEQLEFLSDKTNESIFEKREFPISKKKSKEGSDEFIPSKIRKIL